jgi:hypothetical protein
MRPHPRAACACHVAGVGYLLGVTVLFTILSGFALQACGG